MLDKRYDFNEIETRYATAWEADGCFNTIEDGREAFAIMMPPPNVTGTLHIGHALDNTLPDILVRRARMQGKDALYQPGTDHASIAVHVILEKQWAKEGKTRFDFGREAFLDKAWAWKDHSSGVITSQLRRLGISCNWQNERFTMDPAYVSAVNRAFVTLYDKGLIYRGQRLVNWDPKMQTAVSDLEVKHKEVQGHLWHVAYKFANGFTYDGRDGIVIATTRPETILADAAIAIHPDDPRAGQLVGKLVMVPLVERAIPIVADDMVDPDFGSGMVKITPAHDFNDYAFYQRHKDEVEMPLINLLTPDARMNDNAPEEYRGLDRFVARKAIVADLETDGLLVGVEPHVHNVGHAERDDTILEPYLTWQWYISAGPLAKRCLEAADRGDIIFVNDRDAKVYRHWLENIQDWCISRQLWWGHRIPAWYRAKPGQMEPEIYVGEDAPEGQGWVQDQDILDTWFSSGLWPFATQGWPHSNERLKLYYPGHVVMSGRDILFFWLVRMMMMGLELTDQVPFKAIYTHGLILDEQGQKMSKTKGNVVDPMVLIQEFGADALRFTMASICSSEDMRFSRAKLEQTRNFCTKLWNAARFVMMKDIRHTPAEEAAFDESKLKHPVNKWIVARLGGAFQNVDELLDQYEFAQASARAYHFTWGTWCDWYLELTKPLLASGDAELVAETSLTMGWAFEKLLLLLHPFLPFITEEIWQQLTMAGRGVYLMNHRWPAYASWKKDQQADANVEWLVEMIGAIRQLRATYRLPAKTVLDIQAIGLVDEDILRMDGMLPLLGALAGVGTVENRAEAVKQGEASFIVGGKEYTLPLHGLIDIADENRRLSQDLVKSQVEVEKIHGMLSNENFVARAPAEIVETNKARLEELKVQIRATEALLAGPYKLV